MRVRGATVPWLRSRSRSSSQPDTGHLDMPPLATPDPWLAHPITTAARHLPPVSIAADSSFIASGERADLVCRIRSHASMILLDRSRSISSKPGISSSSVCKAASTPMSASTSVIDASCIHPQAERKSKSSPSITSTGGPASNAPDDYPHTARRVVEEN